ncbi:MULTISPECIES: hypothetical protein [unclassified Flavobacterium]|uniref:hypothetical protein n=1 Tax=unclassified Flavobacterium TaxID=196869 RepID=UPI0018EEFEFE|nr:MULTISPECIES: hypothetical protein [unclassified Flavobacterium]
MQTVLKKIIPLVPISFFFTSCSVVEGIFKAGMGVGIFIVIALIAVIVWIISRITKK